MSFSQKVADEALGKCGRCCCICHKFCGTKIELHHIKQKAYGGEDTLENCIPLCFDCHSDMGRADPKHPGMKQYSETELKMHRDGWYSKVKNGNISENAHVCEEDIALFNRIRKSFTENIYVTLKYQDFRGISPYSLHSELDRICQMKNNPVNEFIDVELEIMRSNLFDCLNIFKCYMAANTFGRMIGNVMYCVPRLWLLKEGEIVSREKEYEEIAFNQQFERYEAEATKLNEYADQLWKAYDEFVRQGRRRILR